MKKLTTIFLLFLLLFNLFGYRFWFDYMQNEANKQLEASLDKEDYNEQDLITIKVPLSLPYQSDWKDFERVNGEITLSGKTYKYVKRKVFHGELVLQCLPDANKMQLETAKDEFFKLANDLQQNASSKTSGHKNAAAFKAITSDYDDKMQEWFIAGINQEKNHFGTYCVNSIFAPILASPGQPPEVVLV